jgi:hypothetical protein
MLAGAMPNRRARFLKLNEDGVSFGDEVVLRRICLSLSHVD